MFTDFDQERNFERFCVKHLGYSVKELRVRRRTAPVRTARNWYYIIANKVLKYTMKDVAKYVERTHGTVVKKLETHEFRLEHVKEYKEQFEELRKAALYYCKPNKVKNKRAKPVLITKGDQKRRFDTLTEAAEFLECTPTNFNRARNLGKTSLWGWEIEYLTS